MYFAAWNPLRPSALLLALFAQESAPAFDLSGLWKSEAVFGPEVRGPLVVRKIGDELWAEIQGHTAEVDAAADELHFELPGRRGSFSGWREGSDYTGFWVQPPGRIGSEGFATPVTLRAAGDSTWSGDVEPLDERLSLYFEFVEVGDELHARFRNPERNLGIAYDLGRVSRRGRDLSLFNSDGSEVLLHGRVSESGARWTLDLERSGLTFEFVPASRDSATGYFPADENRTPYRYRVPLAGADGWPVAEPADVGMRVAMLEALVQSVLDTRYEARSTPYIQSLQVARHGSLVLDEYFHGFHRDRPRDTRSSTKTLTAMLTGIAIDQGHELSVEMSVLDVLADLGEVQNVDDRKRALTVEHLLSMTSGFDCDDDDTQTPGNEGRMQEQREELDWVRYALDLPMVREPGERAVYCTAGINLLGGVIESATGQELGAFFAKSYARPLQIERYHLNLDPTGRPYMGGGMRLRPRDHLKLGQLLVDRGRWQGERIVSSSWIERMSAGHATVYAADDYGYGVWRTDLEFEGQPFEVVYASGNGGQLVIAVPSLDLVVLFSAGNYMNFPTWISFLRDLVPSYVLPAIEE